MNDTRQHRQQLINNLLHDEDNRILLKFYFLKSTESIFKLSKAQLSRNILSRYNLTYFHLIFGNICVYTQTHTHPHTCTHKLIQIDNGMHSFRAIFIMVPNVCKRGNKQFVEANKGNTIQGGP